jgi:hypothetical protein
MNTNCDMQTCCQVTAISTGDNTKAVAKEQLYEHVSPATKEHTIMETFPSRSAPGLYKDDQYLVESPPVWRRGRIPPP